MGYTRHYNSSVSYSGSVSYPRSENGGSVNYSGTIPINITINVDTDSFENSVNGLTGSVIAMNAAQCAAIKQTEKEISQSLINGFFTTVTSELSQQIQALDSAVKADFGLLLEQGKAVTGKKDIMEGDYHRISSRYVRLFDDLDNECYKRIYALDKQSFTLSEKTQKELLSDSACNTAAMNLLGIEEASSSKAMILASSINRKTLDVLTTLHEYITQESSINSLVNSLLLDEETNENISLNIPVIWSECDTTEGSFSENGLNCECFIPGFIEHQDRQAITKNVNGFYMDPASQWEVTDNDEKESLAREFNILSESHYANAEGEEEQRVYKTMLSLWQNSQLLSLRRGI